jgi:hypothetical protein
MSEYQYYDFRAIDKPLDQDEIDALRSVSSRAEITSTSFTNEYSYGSFRGKPEDLMSRYFDAFVYVANWGTHRLMFRLPRRLFDLDKAATYCNGNALKLVEKKGFVLLEFASEEEGGGEWVDGKSWMPSLVSLRADLLRGDLRALYLGWLASFESRGWYDVNELGEDGDLHEPSVPPDMSKLSALFRRGPTYSPMQPRLRWCHRHTRPTCLRRRPARPPIAACHREGQDRPTARDAPIDRPIRGHLVPGRT